MSAILFSFSFYLSINTKEVVRLFSDLILELFPAFKISSFFVPVISKLIYHTYLTKVYPKTASWLKRKCELAVRLSGKQFTLDQSPSYLHTVVNFRSLQMTDFFPKIFYIFT